MTLLEPQSFSFDIFEGPLDLLWHLINRQEIDIYDVPLFQIIQQYLTKAASDDNSLDKGAEFISLAATLLWYKSKALLPKQILQEELIKDELDPGFEIIHHLVDYCKFKQAAKDLSDLEKQQTAHYSRGVDAGLDLKKNLGIDHLSVEDLNVLFQQILAKTASQKGVVHEEEWKVGDKIKLFREVFTKQKSIPFITMFTRDQSREELIVTFLALLELMKIGEARVVMDVATQVVYIQIQSAPMAEW
jgi:segregation and condensation protein A